VGVTVGVIVAVGVTEIVGVTVGVTEIVGVTVGSGAGADPARAPMGLGNTFFKMISADDTISAAALLSLSALLNIGALVDTVDCSSTIRFSLVGKSDGTTFSTGIVLNPLSKNFSALLSIG
jgi:hypothetical protein